MVRLFVIMLVGSLAAAVQADVVVTKDGRRLVVEGPPVYENGKVRLTMKAGVTIEMKESEIDRAATGKANAAQKTAKGAFTNEDLAGAKGLSAAEGTVQAEGKDAPMPERAGNSPAAAAAAGDIVDMPINQVKLLKQVKPRYPAEAKAAGVSGVVICEAIIGTDGTVSETKILRSIPLLDAAAVEAVSQWVFEPATNDQREPVRVRLAVTVQFNIERSQRTGAEGDDPEESQPEE